MFVDYLHTSLSNTQQYTYNLLAAVFPVCGKGPGTCHAAVPVVVQNTSLGVLPACVCRPLQHLLGTLLAELHKVTPPPLYCTGFQNLCYSATTIHDCNR